MRTRNWFAPAAEFMRLRIYARTRRFPAPKLSAFLCALLWLPFSVSAAPRWNIQFSYDHADSNFAIDDLECPTAEHCVAAGLIDDKKGHAQGAVVVSSDGGAHWSQYEVKEHPLSLFFLNDGLGWMVTDRGLWSTSEGGRSWAKIYASKDILQTWFLDADHGYIAGIKGLVEETADGGKTWSKVDVNGEASETDAKELNFDIISFQGSHGVIIGADVSPSATLWEAGSKPATSGKLTVLETLDAGKKWAYGAIPVDGELAQFRMWRGFVVTLIQYTNPKYPIGSGVFRTSAASRQTRLIFGERDRVATDIALLSNGGAILATVEPPGASTQVPIPGKLKMFESSNLKLWREMDVDYRAVAQHAILAAPDSKHIWVATDTGAILKLVE